MKDKLARDELLKALRTCEIEVQDAYGCCAVCPLKERPDCHAVMLSAAADMLQDYVDRCKRYADEIMALRERVKQGMRGDKYYEIWALWAFCKRQDVPAEIVPLFDGWKLVFPNGDDFVQHEYSYMSIRGDLEPAIGCEDDYSPVCLDDARALVLKHRQRLAVPRVELPDKPEVPHDDT